MADNLNTLFEACEESFKSGKADAQLEQLKSELEKNPDNAEILWRIARVYYELGMAAYQDPTKQVRLDRGRFFYNSACARLTFARQSCTRLVGSTQRKQ